MNPKPFLENIKLRNKAIGVRRRRDMAKLTMLKAPYFPEPITYEDIDQEFLNWVKRDFEMSYDGAKVDVIRLFSNQRFSEYDQTWQQLDSAGNLKMNFLTVTRENNPQHGEEQGPSYNIPGERYYPMYYVPMLQENGTEAYDVYEMKQPYTVNFIYTVGIITNKYDLLNEFNSLIHKAFKALECYIRPNGHYMPLILDSITDESEYGIDNRKYYSQSFKVKLKGYIIRKEDFRVTRLPSKLNIVTNGFDVDRRRKDRNQFKLQTTLPDAIAVTTVGVSEYCGNEYELSMSGTSGYNGNIIDVPDDVPIIVVGDDGPIVCGTKDDDYFDDFVENPDVDVDVSVDEEEGCVCDMSDREDPPESSHYHNKRIVFTINFPNCRNKIVFDSDVTFIIDSINTKNVFDMILKINGEKVDFKKQILVSDGDEITVKLTRADVESGSVVILNGFDPDVVYDDRYNPESFLDEETTEENVIINVG